MAPKKLILLLSRELPNAAAIPGNGNVSILEEENIQVVMVDPDLSPEDVATFVAGERGGSAGVVASFGPAGIGGRSLEKPADFAARTCLRLGAEDPALVFCGDGSNQTLWTAIGFCRGVACAEELCAPIGARVFVAKGLGVPTQI